MERLGTRIDPNRWNVSVQPGLAPRLLEDLPPRSRPARLADHRRDFAVPPRPRRGGDPWLIEEIELAGLTGRGGAEYPAARKWRTVAEGVRPVVVVNGAEGEPAAGKDVLLLARLPHLVLDGALLAAAAVGADRIFVCVGAHAPEAVDAVERALRERDAARELAGVRVEIHVVPDRYVAGESGALVAMLNGEEAVPVSTPFRTAERGFQKRPTLVHNAETLAHAALILRSGAAWYRAVGTAGEPGTRLVSLSGALAEPVVSEVEAGTPLREIFEANGGDPAEVSAVLIGGYYGTWVRADDAFAADLTTASLSRFDATPGCGILHFHSVRDCGVTAVARLAAWFSRESAGQCGPCVFGLEAIAGALGEITRDEATVATWGHLDRWVRELPGRGGCSLPDGAARMLSSGFDVFAAEFARHRAGRCQSLLGAVR